MPGGLNPREYDLGELRDAAREPPRRGGTEIPVESLSDDGASVEDRQSASIEPAVEVSRPQADDPSGGADARRAPEPDPETDAAEDVEAYLQSRHRRRQDRTDADQERDERAAVDRSGGPEPLAPNAATFLSELSGPHVSKPYLDTLPDAYSAQLEVFEWLDELLSAAGREATLSALAYYESIGWLSERSREELEDVAAGLSTPDAVGRPLDIDDHRESLIYVARLAHRRRS
jgi:archaellum component FlaD/FlaE